MVGSEKVRSLVRGWFVKTAEDEWRRLKRDPYHQLEFLVTTHFLEKYLSREGFRLDAGGGPGRYTIELAKEMLEIARKQIRKERLQSRVKEIVEGSVTDLSTFSDQTFDAVLCLGGPLSHL